jgi:predicted AlkP superfamily phosphohydrolase/phosphomutase
MVKRARYEAYLRFSYQTTDHAVRAILEAVGTDKHGEPLADMLVVSDHGMAPFHTAVNLGNLLGNAGVDVTKLGLCTTGPAAHVYVNPQGREAGGTVAPGDYQALVNRVAEALRSAKDPNSFYNPASAPLFTHVFTRPANCPGLGLCTD